ncbi:MAG: SRPBCC family protein [Betaproteobacteria bacterium]
MIAVLGRREEALWTVQACNAPHRWEIATDTSRGAAHIVYRITPTARGCRFDRDLAFRSRRWPWRSLDSTLMRWILVRQSAQALRNLKRVVEAQRC